MSSRSYYLCVSLLPPIPTPYAPPSPASAWVGDGLFMQKMTWVE